MSQWNALNIDDWNTKANQAVWANMMDSLLERSVLVLAERPEFINEGFSLFYSVSPGEFHDDS
jgi:hypothetical protein